MANEYWKFVNKLGHDIESAFGSALKSALDTVTAAVEAHTAKQKQFVDSLTLAMCGRQLTDAKVAEFEKYLETNPDQLQMRIVLLGKYGDLQYGNDSELRQRRVEHIAWIIQNQPECPIAGTPFALVSKSDDEGKVAHKRLKELWLEQCSKPEVSVPLLLNAAAFFQQHNKKVAEKCLKRALKMQPLNKNVRKDLVQLYTLWDGHEAEALTNLEVALKLTWNDWDRLSLLESLPDAALAAGNLERATKAADDLLLLAKKFRERKRDSCGDAIHKGHTVLGLVALKKGKTNKAKSHLALSVAGIESPVLCSFGPSLDLVKELASSGERDAVLQYLDRHEQLCGPFNESAFELRYEVEFRKRRTGNDDDEFTQAYLDRQIEILRSHAASKSNTKHSRDDGQIHLTSMQIEWLKKQYEEALQAENYEAAYHADKRRRMYETHLANLKSC